MTTATLILTCLAVVAISFVSYRNVNHLAERLNMSTQEAIDTIVAQLVKAKNELSEKLEQATLGVQAQLVEAGVAEQVDLSALAGIAQALDDLVPDTETVDETVEVDEVETDETVEVDETDETDETDKTVEVDEVEVDEVEVDEVEVDEVEVDETKDAD